MSIARVTDKKYIENQITDNQRHWKEDDVHTMVQMLEQIITNAEAIKSEISYMVKYNK